MSEDNQNDEIEITIPDVEVSAPSPTKSMFFFFMISVIYLILKIYTIQSSDSIEKVVENTNSSVFIIAYILILVIGMYTINLGISQQICGSQQVDYNSVFFSTFLPWILVFGILYFILEIFNGWVRPFSNTIGYFIVSFIGLESTIKKMLKYDEPSVKKAIEKIENNMSDFINEFDETHTEYTEFIKKLQAENITTSSALNLNKIGENEIHLFKLINMKHMIGKVIWYFLAGTIISAISYNNIINQQCERSIQEISRRTENL